MLETSKIATQQIIELHEGIVLSARRSVKDAIKIGEIISKQKKLLSHGQFLPWVATLPFDERTARRYIQVNEYRDKTDTLSDLQTAYRQIETLEAQAKLSKEQIQRNLIAEYRKTGKKPDGWDSSMPYAFEKFAKEDAEKEKIINEKIANMKAEMAKKEEQRLKQKQAQDMYDDILQKSMNQHMNKSLDRSKWKEKIRLSDNGKDSAFMDAIMDYLDTLTDDNRRIEACTNIIKICKNISIELQRIK